MWEHAEEKGTRMDVCSHFEDETLPLRWGRQSRRGVVIRHQGGADTVAGVIDYTEVL